MQYHQFTKVRNTVGFMIGKNLYNKPCLDIQFQYFRIVICQLLSISNVHGNLNISKLPLTL